VQARGNLVHSYYFDGGLDVTYDSASKLVRFVDVSSRTATNKLYQLSGNTDSKLELYGASADEIKRSMGQVALDEFDHLAYSIDHGFHGKGLELDFQCRARQAYRCDDISLMWNYWRDDTITE
jgi:hypothetical protein